MKKSYLPLHILLVTIMLWGCSKNSVSKSTSSASSSASSSSANPTNLVGWWKPNNFLVQAKLYFGADNFFLQDTVEGKAPEAGFWSLSDNVITCRANTVNGPIFERFNVTLLTDSTLSLSIVGIGAKQLFNKTADPAVTTPPMTSIAGIGIDYVNNVTTGPATAAPITGDKGIVTDRAGNIYFSDVNKIRKISTDGTISTYAGSSFGGPYIIPNGTPALNAAITPDLLAIDRSGNIYFTEASSGSQIYRINASDTTITLAAGDRSAYTFSGDGGPATSAGLGNNIGGVTIDANDNLLISDSYHQRIREVDAATGIINTIAGTGTGPRSADGTLALNANILPGSIAVDSTGDIYFADRGNLVRKIDHQTTVITTIAGQNPYPTLFISGDNGPAIHADFNEISCIIIPTGGNMFITDISDNVVRKINFTTGIITRLAGTGYRGNSIGGIHASGYSLNLPAQVAANANGQYIYITDVSYRIHAVGPVSN